jgi:hypothetical protein
MALLITITFIFAGIAATFLAVHWPTRQTQTDDAHDA